MGLGALRATELRSGWSVVLLLVCLPAGAADYTVTATTDTGAGSGLTGDLRYCITQANASADLSNSIGFNIPGGGPQTINLTSSLPTITNCSLLDATGQPGYAGTPMVCLNGPTTGGCLTIATA